MLRKKTSESDPADWFAFASERIRGADILWREEGITAGPDSDLDFLVVIPNSDKTRYERAVEALGFVRGLGGAQDIIVLTRAEWEKELKAPSSLSNTVLREGIALQKDA